MTQSGLIKITVEAAGMALCIPNKTHTSQTAFGSDLERTPIKEIGSIHLC